MARKPAFHLMFLAMFVFSLSLMIAMPSVAAGTSEESLRTPKALDQAGKSPGVRPASPTRRETVTCRQMDFGSKLIEKVVPAYPELAKRARVEGKVSLSLSTDEKGNVTDVRVNSGHPFLKDAAVDALKHWKYDPMFLKGEPVPVMNFVDVIFALDNKATAASVKSRIDLAVADAIMRNKAGQSISDMPFIRKDTADLELMVATRTADVTSKLKSSGFEVVAWPAGSKKVIGGIAIEKLEILLNIDAVQYIAPHLP
jgi:TonB family protein